MPTASPQVRERIDTLEIFNIFRRRDEDTILYTEDDRNISDIPSSLAFLAGFLLHRTATTVEAQEMDHCLRCLFQPSFEGCPVWFTVAIYTSMVQGYVNTAMACGTHPQESGSRRISAYCRLSLISIVSSYHCSSWFRRDLVAGDSSGIVLWQETFSSLLLVVRLRQFTIIRTLIQQDTIGYDVGTPYHPVDTDASGSAPSSGCCYPVLLIPFFLKYHLRRPAQLSSSSPKAFQLGNITVDLFFLCDAVGKADSPWNTFNILPSFRRTNSLYWSFGWFSRIASLAVYIISPRAGTLLLPFSISFLWRHNTTCA
ncbi:hypothetical protein Aduo_009904 [Ancylostoma duodenale]